MISIFKNENISNYFEKLKLEFKYESNKYRNGLKQIDYKNLPNTFDDYLVEKYYKIPIQINTSMIKFLCEWPLTKLRHKISGGRIRFIDEDFDLDLSYITKKVIAMCYPSDNCIESFYRNDKNKIIRFFDKYLGSKVKVYNLCQEKNKIYGPNYFSNFIEVGLFPILDHCCCPIQMTLEFCADACSYISNNPDHYIAIHCKAGKGRTGSMICAYLLFSGLCNTSEEAMFYYAERRSDKGKGVTVPSQIRYLKHFEVFLNLNYEKPFYKQVPKIFSFSSIENSNNNLLHSVFNKNSKLFANSNNFTLKKIKIGPFTRKMNLEVILKNFSNTILFNSKTHVDYVKVISEEQQIGSSKKLHFIVLEFEGIKIDKDFEIKVKGDGLYFFVWLNFYYISLQKIVNFLDKNTIEKQKSKELTLINRNEVTNKVFYENDLSTYLSKNSESNMTKNSTKSHQPKQKISNNFITILLIFK